MTGHFALTPQEIFNAIKMLLALPGNDKALLFNSLEYIELLSE
jgi:hypothetical protein